MKSWIALIALLPAAGWAQPVQADGGGVSHDCMPYYPQAEARAGIEGTTKLWFMISERGRVYSIDIVQSSGNRHLDLAARACVSRWRYSPAMQDGRPIAISWKADVVWKTAPAHLPELAETPRNCLQSYPVTPTALAGHDGISEYEYVIVHGAVWKVTLLHSSGNAALDQAGSSCISSRRYVREMVMADGVEQDRYTTITLREKINWADALKSGK